MKRNIFFSLVSIVILAGNACTHQSGLAESHDKFLAEALDSLIQPYIDSAQIAGLAIGVAKNDTVLFIQSYGYADLEFNVPLPVSASFEIGSVTKQFTSVAILQLVEQGLINLQDDFSDYLTFDTKGRAISIEQLMNHTSGIKGYTEMPTFQHFSVHDYPRDTLLRMVENENFDFEPGEAMIYNNTAYFMLGLIIEKVSGQSYEEYLRENIFAPAGMKDSYYCDERVIRKNKAYGYDTGEDGILLKAAYLDHTWPYSAGSICSTVNDLLRWNHLLHNTEILLNRESYEQLIAPSHLADGTPLRYAKGLLVDQYKGIDVISHGGGINGFLSDSRFFPDQGLAIVTLINSTGPVSPESISNFVADLLIPVQEIKTQEQFKGDLSSFTGTYKGNARGSHLVIKVEPAGQKITLQINEDKDTLDYAGDHKWIMDSGFCIFKEEQGKVKTLHIDGGYGYYILEKEVI